MRLAKVLIRLLLCTDCFEPLLVVHITLYGNLMSRIICLSLLLFHSLTYMVSVGGVLLLIYILYLRNVKMSSLKLMVIFQNNFE